MPDTLDQIVLGLDYGQKNIGIAIGNRRTRSAQPLTTLNTRSGQFPWSELDRLVTQWTPDIFLIGVVPSHSGSINPARRQFQSALGARYGMPVVAWDESHTSEAARSEIRQRRADGRKPRRVTKGFEDAVAAALLVTSYLETPGA
ncbi:Resolvase, holliday junction-type, YqgF-like protein [mine drainage metagenome]|uniref:Resolvase, holliday junction-type, YqgF-like protein n=1 Tax=mine drainage metagenome TaxID=410659 RepID=T1C657_9ZZZZ